jgi:hypothetical protein
MDRIRITDKRSVLEAAVEGYMQLTLRLAVLAGRGDIDETHLIQSVTVAGDVRRLVKLKKI